MRTTSWLALAAKVAARSTERFQHGAVLVAGGRVVAVGWNRRVLDPFYYPDAPRLSVHAEEAALRSLERLGRVGGDDTPGRRYVLYVVRLSRTGGLALSAPCRRCQHVIEEFGKIKRIVHS